MINEKNDLIILNVIGSYNANVIGISIFKNNKFKCIYDKGKIKNVLLLLKSKPVITHNAKETIYLIKKEFDIDINLIIGTHEFLYYYGINENSQINELFKKYIKSRLYDVNVFSIIPKEQLEALYYKKSLFIHDDYKKLLNYLQLNRNTKYNAIDHIIISYLSISELEYNSIQLEGKKQLYNITNSRTGRISNLGSCLSRNLLSLPKNSIDRQKILPKNDFFMEIDISNYEIHLGITLYCNDKTKNIFNDKDVYNLVSEQLKIDRKKAKELLIRHFYSDTNYTEFNDMFGSLSEIKNKTYYSSITNNVVINSFGRNIIINENDIKRIEDNHSLPFSYLLQSDGADTSYQIIYSLNNYLEDYKTKLCFFCYDSFLFDVKYDEFKDIYSEITNIIKTCVSNTYLLPIKITIGKNYGNMKIYKEIL